MTVECIIDTSVTETATRSGLLPAPSFGGRLLLSERSVLIFCQGRRKSGVPCKTILGSAIGDTIVVKYRGREISAHGVNSIRCENCGWEWRPEETR